MPHRIAHAKAYPFAIPGHSYLLKEGRAEPLPAGGRHRDGRLPVIACGSNRSPERLGRKYAEFAGDGTIPVERARLAHFDVVYSAHITRYGSVPATLAASPGTRVEVSVTWLSEDQLEVMHASESTGENYDFMRLGAVQLALEGDGGWGEVLEAAFVYGSRRGALSHRERPVAMAAATAERRRHPALHQEEVQALVHARLGEADNLDRFILGSIEDAALRARRIARLAEDAHAQDWPGAVVIEV